MSGKGGSVREFIAIFLRTTLIFWGLLALAFAGQFFLGGRESVTQSDFLNPIVFTFFAIPVAAVLIAVAGVQRRKKSNSD